ncbi:DNA-binding XRE family transcriptional regulator [Devosia sp. UYZn731]|uniref:helix-turn-helix domain-containing protein n=1 Tax=Devosia sp. UYZn731 TaxID=3156345 RepID=UPI0033930102
MTPGGRLRYARRMAGYGNASDAARAVGIGVSTYRGHENGKNAFTPAQAQKYAEAFNTDASWLLYGDAEQHGEPAISSRPSPVVVGDSRRLMQSLHDTRLLNGEETVEVYEQALLLLEMQQAKADENPAYGQSSRLRAS